jgi:two-component system, OmpR family, phosphate regulon sensor histidine kinase PhoR
MKEWKLRVLITFSFISIAGLMLIQIYWIRDAIEVKENHFRQTVDQAVTNVVWNLERIAMAKEEELWRDQLRKNRAQLKLLDSMQNLRAIGEGLSFPSLFDAVFPLSIQEPDERKIPQIYIFGDSAPQHGEYIPYGISDDDYTANRYDLFSDSLMEFFSQTAKQRDQYMYIRGYLEDLFKEGSLQTHPNKDLAELLDSATLFRMISEELAGTGVKKEFRYAVYAPYTGKVLFADHAFLRELPLLSEYSYDLFPNFRLSNPVHLVLDFPGEKRYLFSNLGGVISLSMVLTLLLIWSLYFITRNTYRQKKIGEMKNDFINNMTHEFKTPVSTISLACEALRDNDVEKSGVLIDNYLKIIDEENRRLGKLAEQILQTAIIDKGHLYLTFEEADIHQIIRQVVEKYKPVTELNNGMIKTRLFAENPCITADKTHIHNMISNLVDNAIKYSSVKLLVEIITTSTTESVTISIQDQGIGISRANQKKIFDKLYRVPTGDLHNAKGFGLGLSYVKYIVERHDGIVQVDSELNKGSRFVVTLPRIPMKINEHRRI